MSFTDHPFPSGWEITTNNYLVTNESSNTDDVFESLSLDLGAGTQATGVDKDDDTLQRQILVQLEPAYDILQDSTIVGSGNGSRLQHHIIDSLPVIALPFKSANSNGPMSSFARINNDSKLDTAFVLQQRSLPGESFSQSFTTNDSSGDSQELTPLLNATFQTGLGNGKFAIMLTEPWSNLSNLCLASISPGFDLNSSEVVWSQNFNASNTFINQTQYPSSAASLQSVESSSIQDSQRSPTLWSSGNSNKKEITLPQNPTSQDPLSSDDSGVSTSDSFVASVASSFSQGSPYSSLASPCPSQQGFFDSSPSITRTLSKEQKSDFPEYDPDLEKIVDDVDDMYRDHLRLLHPTPPDIKSDLIESITRSFEGLENCQDLVKRNLSAEKSLNNYDLTARNIADKIAKRLVERALEKDRKTLLRKLQRRSRRISESQTEQQQLEGESKIVADNYVDVAANRVLDDVVEEMINCATSDVANSLKYRCKGDKNMLSSVEVEDTVNMLQRELESFVDEFGDRECSAPSCGGLRRGKDFILTDEDFLVNFESPEFEEFLGGETRWRGSQHVCTRSCEETIRRQRKRKYGRTPRKKCPAVAKKDIERSRRNKMGILVSSLRKKVYHCRCVDCQAKRRNEGKPEPEEPIQIEEINFPSDDISPDMIPVPQRKGRGRPRKYLRIEDVIEWREQQQQKTSQIKNELQQKTSQITNDLQQKTSQITNELQQKTSQIKNELQLQPETKRIEVSKVEAAKNGPAGDVQVVTIAESEIVNLLTSLEEGSNLSETLHGQNVNLVTPLVGNTNVCFSPKPVKTIGSNHDSNAIVPQFGNNLGMDGSTNLMTSREDLVERLTPRCGSSNEPFTMEDDEMDSPAPSGEENDYELSSTSMYEQQNDEQVSKSSECERDANERRRQNLSNKFQPPKVEKASDAQNENETNLKNDRVNKLRLERGHFKIGSAKSNNLISRQVFLSGKDCQSETLQNVFDVGRDGGREASTSLKTGDANKRRIEHETLDTFATKGLGLRLQSNVQMSRDQISENELAISRDGQYIASIKVQADLPSLNPNEFHANDINCLAVVGGVRQMVKRSAIDQPDNDHISQAVGVISDASASKENQLKLQNAETKIYQAESGVKADCGIKANEGVKFDSSVEKNNTNNGQMARNGQYLHDICAATGKNLGLHCQMVNSEGVTTDNSYRSNTETAEDGCSKVISILLQDPIINSKSRMTENEKKFPGNWSNQVNNNLSPSHHCEKTGDCTNTNSLSLLHFEGKKTRSDKQQKEKRKTSHQIGRSDSNMKINGLQPLGMSDTTSATTNEKKRKRDRIVNNLEKQQIEKMSAKKVASLEGGNFSLDENRLVKGFSSSPFNIDLKHSSKCGNFDDGQTQLKVDDVILEYSTDNYFSPPANNLNNDEAIRQGDNLTKKAQLDIIEITHNNTDAITGEELEAAQYNTVEINQSSFPMHEATTDGPVQHCSSQRNSSLVHNSQTASSPVNSRSKKDLESPEANSSRQTEINCFTQGTFPAAIAINRFDKIIDGSDVIDTQSGGGNASDLEPKEKNGINLATATVKTESTLQMWDSGRTDDHLSSDLILVLPKKEESICCYNEMELNAAPFVDMPSKYDSWCQDDLVDDKDEVEIVGEKIGHPHRRFVYSRGSFIGQLLDPRLMLPSNYPCCLPRYPCQAIVSCMCPVPESRPKVPRLKKCYVRMEDAKAVCEAFMAATQALKSSSRPAPRTRSVVKVRNTLKDVNKSNIKKRMTNLKLKMSKLRKLGPAKRTSKSRLKLTLKLNKHLGNYSLKQKESADM